MSAAIRVEGLGKSFMISHGSTASYSTLREDLSSAVGRMMGRRAPPAPREEFWALRDISFDVQAGERLGIVGHNGAGKSTLLKLLSRVMHPTAGRISLRGHVASLLEVGTGFHPELTGRENIFLNAAILGMSKADIRRNFEAIVAFSDVERFLDTPVKRYSSGMYLRLAFAVAAHLEPEILIIDEVLAVGDVQFQRKCLGKMEEIGKSGRTVLFVSHNLRAIRTLCPRSLILKAGRVLADGPTEEVLQTYSDSSSAPEGSRSWDPQDPDFRLLSATLLTPGGQTGREFAFLDPIVVELRYSVLREKPYRVKVGINSADDIQIFVSAEFEGRAALESKRPGEYVSRCVIPGHLLNEGRYTIDVHVDVSFERVFADERRALDFTVMATEEMVRFRDRPYGLIVHRVTWTTEASKPLAGGAPETHS